MLRHSSTAAPAPSMAAAPTAPVVPLYSPKTTETTTIPVQIHAIAMLCRPPLPVGQPGPSLYI